MRLQRITYKKKSQVASLYIIISEIHPLTTSYKRSLLYKKNKIVISRYNQHKSCNKCLLSATPLGTVVIL